MKSRRQRQRQRGARFAGSLSSLAQKFQNATVPIANAMVTPIRMLETDCSVLIWFCTPVLSGSFGSLSLSTSELAWKWRPTDVPAAATALPSITQRSTWLDSCGLTVGPCAKFESVPGSAWPGTWPTGVGCTSVEIATTAAFGLAGG